MGKQYKKLNSEDIEFIQKQKLFFIASSSNAEVNLSPKGHDCIKLINDNTQVLYLDYPGSGNRTARDIENDGEITIMFNAFEGPANITRLFCKGETVLKSDMDFSKYLSQFDVNVDVVRQFFIFTIYAVESSCGMTVPKMDYKQERSGLKKWAKNMSENGELEDYIKDHHTPINLKDLS